MRARPYGTADETEDVGPEGWRRVLLLCVPIIITTSTKADRFRRFEVVTGVGLGQQWSDENKARIVAESLDPATTASAVARRYGLHASQLFTWASRSE